MTLKSKALRGVAAGLVAATLATGGIGFLHTPGGRQLPIGRKLLAWMKIQCPLDRAGLTSEHVEASRQKGLSALRGIALAPARPALAGLELDHTDEAMARAWSEKHGIQCKTLTRGMRFLKCEAVAPSSLDRDPGQTPIHMLTLAFSPSGKLVAVDVFRRKLGAPEAGALMRGLSSRLRAELGAPSEKMGEITAEFASRSMMKTAFIHYRFRDYVAMLTASNLPWSGGITVHEQYSSVAASSISSSI